MSTAPADYELLLRDAIDRARAAAPRATEDLLRFASKAGEAVARVTGGAAALDLVPIPQADGQVSAYQLQLRKVGSEAPPSDLGVYSVTSAGYPVLRWYNRRAWESRPDKPDKEYPSDADLEGNFRWIVSDPSSRLVVLVTFFEQEAASGTSSDVGANSGG